MTKYNLKVSVLNADGCVCGECNRFVGTNDGSSETRESGLTLCQGPYCGKEPILRPSAKRDKEQIWYEMSLIADDLGEVYLRMSDSCCHHNFGNVKSQMGEAELYINRLNQLEKELLEADQ